MKRTVRYTPSTLSRRIAGVILLATGCVLVTGCIPIGARVQNMYAQGATPAPASR